jgi:hypothetical protein
MTAPPDDMPSDLRKALQGIGAKPDEPWWVWSAWMARGSRALSRDAELDLVQRVANSADSAFKAAVGRAVRGLDIRTSVAVGLGLIAAYAFGVGTAVTVRSDAGPLSREVAAVLRHNGGMDDALRQARPAGSFQGRSTVWVRLYTAPARTPPP